MSQVKPGELYPQYDHNAPIVSDQPMPQPMTHQTTVIVQNSPPRYGPRDWNTGLFDCTDDLSLCLCGLFCGLCLTCKVSQDMGESLCVPICLPLPLAILRTKWRTEQNIQGSIMEDCLMNSFCGACAVCQLAREVKTFKNKM